MEILHLLADDQVLHNLVRELSTVTLLLLVAVCIIVLSKGADCLVDGAVGLAERMRMPRIVIGATIVSLGTTMPEAFVSVMAAWMGNPGLALGNGVGSIIADTGMIFGLSCMLTVIPMNRYILNRTGWIQVGAATLLVVISLCMWLTTEGVPVLPRWVGVLFLVLLCGYMYVTYRWAKQSGSGPSHGSETASHTIAQSLGRCWLNVVVGLILVIVAARILIPVVSEIAHRVGVPEDVIAATMVALGTSLPELITAIAALRKGHPEIMVGNIVGADVLNCLFVIGAAAAARPLAIPINFFIYHFPAMLLILYLFRAFIFVNKDNRFRRWQGACLFGIYAVYVIAQYAFQVGGS